MSRAGALGASARRVAATMMRAAAEVAPTRAERLQARAGRITAETLYAGKATGRPAAEIEPPRGRGRSSSDVGLSSFGASGWSASPRQEPARGPAVNNAAPQPAVVKVVSAAGGAARARALLTYLGTRETDEIGKRADIALRTERGETIASAGAREALLQSWLPSFDPARAGRKPRDVFHVVFSARAGTDPERFLVAVEATLDRAFAGHPWVVAPHDDRRHVHVHALILARGAEGRKLDPRIPDLHRYRETLAEAAREHGIAMTATRRERAAARFYTLAQARLVERGEAHRKTAARVAAARQGHGDPPRPDPRTLASLMEALMAQRTSTEIRSTLNELQGLLAEMGKLVPSQARGAFEASRDKLMAAGEARLAQAMAQEMNAERAADHAIQEAREPLSPGGSRVTPREAERIGRAALDLDRSSRSLEAEAGRAFATAILAREGRSREEQPQERSTTDLARAALERRQDERQRLAERRQAIEGERDAEALRRLREMGRDREAER